MSEKPSNTIWVRFTWNLNDLQVDIKPPEQYKFRSASVDELDKVLEVVLAAYSSDLIWLPLMEGIRKRMTDRIHSTIGKPDVDYIIAEFGDQIVAVSGIAKSHWTSQNLLTGICVLPEHQRKGLGKYLLGLSLMRLKEMDLQQACVYTEAKSLADRKIYSLYGSSREENVKYPGVRQPLKIKKQKWEPL
ncbi:MAG: GNAT family N-acetyltransferase [Acidobacteriota bacterium]